MKRHDVVEFESRFKSQTDTIFNPFGGRPLENHNFLNLEFIVLGSHFEQLTVFELFLRRILNNKKYEMIQFDSILAELGISSVWVSSVLLV